jgi:outer membrane receptor protein involved in Fe transport
VILNGDWYQSGHFGAQYGKNFSGYGVGNMRLALNNIANARIDLALFAKNILDRKYLIGPDVLLPTFPVSVGYYAPPRQFGMELRYSF